MNLHSESLRKINTLEQNFSLLFQHRFERLPILHHSNHQQITGVSIAFVSPDFKMLLGKENDGRYKGFFNFIGGKKDIHESISQTCFREIFEELGVLIISPLNFINSIIGMYIAGFSTLMIVCKLNWSSDIIQSLNMFAKFKLHEPNIPSCYKELDEIKEIHFERSRVQIVGCSEYVNQQYVKILDILKDSIYSDPNLVQTTIDFDDIFSFQP